MAFKDYKYERPNYQEVKVQLTSLIEEFTKAANAEEQFE